MSTAPEPLTAEEIAGCTAGARLMLRLCAAAESAAAKDVEIAELRGEIDRLRQRVKYWADSAERVGDALATLRQRAERAEADAGQLAAVRKILDGFYRDDGTSIGDAIYAIRRATIAASQPPAEGDKP